MTTQANAIIIPADPTEAIRRETIPTGLSAAKSVVGGWIELVANKQDEGWVAYGNEEAKMLNLPTNPRAHDVLVKLGGHNPDDMLRGNVLIIGATGDGESTDVPADLWGKVLAVPGASISE